MLFNEILSQKKINERIDFAYKDLKIPENAQRIFCDNKNFRKLYKCGDIEIYDMTTVVAIQFTMEKISGNTIAGLNAISRVTGS